MIEISGINSPPWYAVTTQERLLFKKNFFAMEHFFSISLFEVYFAADMTFSLKAVLNSHLIFLLGLGVAIMASSKLIFHFEGVYFIFFTHF